MQILDGQTRPQEKEIIFFPENGQQKQGSATSQIRSNKIDVR